MATFTEINYQGSLRGTDFMWGVHVSGCKAINDDLRKQFGTWRLPYFTKQLIMTDHDASSLRELLDQVVDGECRDLGWGDDNVKVHHCVTKVVR